MGDSLLGALSEPVPEGIEAGELAEESPEAGDGESPRESINHSDDENDEFLDGAASVPLTEVRRERAAYVAKLGERAGVSWGEREGRSGGFGDVREVGRRR